MNHRLHQIYSFYEFFGSMAQNTDIIVPRLLICTKQSPSYPVFERGCTCTFLHYSGHVGQHIVT